MADSKNNTITIVFEGDSKRIEATLKRLEKGLKAVPTKVKPVNNSMNGLLATAKKLLPAMSAAFAVRQIAIFGKEAILLGAQLEGISSAFQLIEDTGKTSMFELKKATRGAVDEMTLMSLAVQANNFKVPLENLGRFFEFATIRAAQTGESVEHLTRSIVTGIGRKSPLILDNLGITLVRLKEAMGKVGRESASVADISEAVAKIAKEETELLKILGLTATTAAQRIAKLNAGFVNFKTSLGKKVATGGFFGGVMDQLSRMEDAIDTTAKIEAYAEQLNITEEAYTDLRDELSKGLILGKLEKDLLLLEELTKRSQFQFAGARGMVVGMFNDPNELKTLKEMKDWATETGKLLDKMKDNGVFSEQTLDMMSRAVIPLRDEAIEILNAPAVALKKLQEAQKEFIDKTREKLEAIQVKFKIDEDFGLIKKVKEEKAELTKALAFMQQDVDGLKLASLPVFSEWGGQLDAANKALDSMLGKLKGEAASTVGDFFGINKKDFPVQGKYRKKLTEEGVLKGLEGSIPTTLSDEEYDGISYEEDAANREKIQSEEMSRIRELATMYNTLASAMGSLASNFNPDSSIAKFLKFAQGAAVAAGAMAALQVAMGDKTAPIAIIAAGASVVAALVGTISGLGLGGGGGGGGYNASSSSSGGRLYTEISGQNLRVVLDRADGFNSRRG